MHGLREPPFLPTKKKQATAGDEDEWIIPALRTWLGFLVFMLFVSTKEVNSTIIRSVRDHMTIASTMKTRVRFPSARPIPPLRVAKSWSEFGSSQVASSSLGLFELQGLAQPNCTLALWRLFCIYQLGCPASPIGTTVLRDLGSGTELEVLIKKRSVGLWSQVQVRPSTGLLKSSFSPCMNTSINTS